MSKNPQIALALPEHQIIERIYMVRGEKVMLDKDLAEMYGVDTRVLNQSVKHNLSRFPPDFMFQFTKDEWEILRSQFAISSWGGARYLPYAFAEQGVAMLSSVLRSEVAIQVNIQIIRVFTGMKQLMLDNKDLWLRLEKMKKILPTKTRKFRWFLRHSKNYSRQPRQNKSP